MRNVPSAVSLIQQLIDLVVGLLLGDPRLSEQMDNVVVDAHGLLFVEGQDVVLPGRVSAC